MTMETLRERAIAAYETAEADARERTKAGFLCALKSFGVAMPESVKVSDFSRVDDGRVISLVQAAAEVEGYSFHLNAEWTLYPCGPLRDGDDWNPLCVVLKCPGGCGSHVIPVRDLAALAQTLQRVCSECGARLAPDEANARLDGDGQ